MTTLAPPEPVPTVVRSLEGRSVLVVAPQPFYEDRGTPIAVRQLVEALATLGAGVELLVFPTGRDVRIPGVRVRKVANPFGVRRVPVGLSLAKVALDAVLVPTLARRLRAERWDVVHAVEEAIFPVLALRRPLRRGGPAVVYDMQSSLPEQLAAHPVLGLPALQRPLRAAERRAILGADAVVASAGLGAHVRGIAPEARMEEWRFAGLSQPPVGADPTAMRRRLGVPVDSPLVAYVGNFASYQGVPLLLEALPFLWRRTPDARVVVVGAVGEEGKRLVERAERCGAAGRLLVVARQPRERLAELLAAADVFVSPRLEGSNLPLKLFDYLAAGRPVVATDVACHRALQIGELATLVPPEPERLGEALARELVPSRERAARVQRGLAWAAVHADGRGFTRRVADFYAALPLAAPAARRASR